MKLTDLDAEFLGNVRMEDGSSCYTRLPSIEGAQGLSFQCPKCAEGLERGVNEDGSGHVKGAHYIVCWFRNPRGAEKVPDDLPPGPGRWWIEGTSLDDLTFSHGEPPIARSILLTRGCGWHGYVTNGDASSC